MSDDAKICATIFLVITIIIVSFLLLVGGLAGGYEYLRCASISKSVSSEYSESYVWNLWTGCRYSIDGVLVPLDNLMYNSFNGDVEIK